MRWVGVALLAFPPVLLAGCGGSPESSSAKGGAETVVVGGRTGNPDTGERVFRQCRACHTVGADTPDTDGPNLHAVVNGPVAQRRPRFAYTAALQARGGVWDVDRLDAWLRDPRAFAPGTTMNFVGLTDPQDRADVIAYLSAQHG